MGVARCSKLTTSFAVVLTVLFSLLGGVVAHAQVTGATLTGTVTDPTGSVVVGAKVSAKDTATATTRDVTTDSAGLYNIPNLNPGAYEVRVTAAGFSTAVQSNLTLAVGQTQQLNFSMKVGETNTTVQVTESAPQIDLTSSALSGQVESQTVRELPLNGRDWTSLAVLQPGVKPIETQMSYATSARGNRGFGGELTVSGQRSTFNNYRIDGISVNDYAMAAPGNVIGVVLGVDAVEEFSVLTGGFPAEYGRATGGVVNAISRSGTNQFHGAVYEFLRNSSLDANDYFTRSAGQLIPPFKRNQFGVSAGAPIIKDKLFVFADYEGLRQTKGIPSVSGVFSNDARLGIIQNPSFLTAAAPIVNPPYNLPAPGATVHTVGSPCSTLSGTSGTWLASNANLCVDNYSATLLGLFPTSGLTKASNADLATLVTAGVQDVPENFGTVRMDYNIGNNDKIFGTFLKDIANYTQPDSYNDVVSESVTARTTIAIEETHTFGSSFVNAARIGFNRDNVQNQFTPTALNPLATFDNTSTQAIDGQGAPRLSVHGGITDFFAGVNGGSHYLHTWNSYQYNDDAIWTKGAHTIKIGGGIERMQYNEHTFQEPAGRYQFNDYVGFLSGIPKSWEAGLLNVVDNPREFRQTTFSLYAQDDWKIKSNLTLNLGLRYEPTTVLKDAQGRITNLATITAAGPTCGTSFSDPPPTGPGGGLPGEAGSTCVGTGPYYNNPTLRNFEPRVGFVWDPFKDGKTSVRSSVGLYDVDPFAGYFLLQQNQAGPFLVFKSVKGDANWEGQNPLAPVWGPGDGGTQLTNFTGAKLAESTVEGTPHRNYVEEWNLTLQHQITSDMSVTLGYVGSHGVHLMMRGDDGNMTGAPQTATPEVSTPYGYLFPGAGAASVNPNLGVVRYIYWNTGSNYNALNVNLDKKFAHGFQFQAAYTYSKSLDDDSQTIAGDTFANGINSPWWWLPKAFYGPSDFNITHTLSVNALYTVPTPKSWTGFRKEALAEWELGGIFTWNSGSPSTVINNGDPLALGNSGADQFGPLVKLPNCSPVNSNWIGGPAPVYINQNCYAEPSVPSSALSSLTYGCQPFAASSSFGNNPANAGYDPTKPVYCSNLSPFNVGRNELNGPNFVNMDFSIHKSFPITKISEAFNVQFRAEIFNIFNHSNFVPPQPCSGDCNAGIYNPDGTSAGVGNLAELAGLPREIQFALKVQW